MKSKLLIIASIVFLAACSKSKVADEVKNDESSLRVQAVVASTDVQSRIQMLGLLTPAEKFSMWQTHLVKAKKQFEKSGEKRKVASIDQLLQNLDASIFDAGSSAKSAVFLNYFIPVWSASAKNIFSEQELYDLTFNPSAQVIGRFADDNVGFPIEGGTANCFCNVGTSGFSCRKITVGTSGITITNGICERNATDCNSSSTGCGWLFLQSCSGNHCQF